MPKKISKHDYAWYYVSSSNISKSLLLLDIPTSMALPIHNNLVSIPLTHKQIERLKSDDSVWIHKISSKHKGHIDTSSKRYLVLCPVDCPLPGKVLSRSSLFSIIKYNGPLLSLRKNTCVRDFDSVREPEFHTRFNIPPTHSYIEYPNSFLPFSPLSNLRGKDQCITIVDSGIDVNSPWFSDPKNNNAAKWSSLKHRKIKNILGFADSDDEPNGHGTFIAGIVGGNAICNSFSSLYNGIAFESKLFIIDILKTGKKNFFWPNNFTDLFEIPSYFNCRIHLNSWSMKGQRLLSQAIDWLAYQNPNILMIFPTDTDKDGFLVSPSDSKNVLTVGPSHGTQASKNYNFTNLPIMVKTPNTSFIGYTDPQGTPFYSPKNKDVDTFLRPLTLNNSQVCVLKGSQENISKDCVVLLFPSQNNIKEKYNIPIIRLPERASKFLEENISISLAPSLHPSDEDPLFDLTKYKLPHLFKIKPDVVAPSGPVIGPKAGSPYCNMSGLTMKEGSSISAAIIAGNLALVNEYLSVNHHTPIKPKGATMKAIIIHSAVIPHHTYEAPSSSFGWGQSLLSEIIPDNINKIGLNIFEDIEIMPFSHKSFVFKTNRAGTIKATCTWFDLPRDPAAPIDISATISMIVSIDGKTQMSKIANSHKNDFPTIDQFNTVKHVEQKVEGVSEVRIIIVSGEFALAEPINISLIVTGPFKNEQYKYSMPEIKRPPCFRECESRGMCIRGFCSCTSDRAGDSCQIKIIEMSPTYSMHGQLNRFEWNMFKFCPSKWSNNSYSLMTFDNFDKNKLGMHVNIGKPPNWETADCTMEKCPNAKLQKDSIKLKYMLNPFISNRKCIYYGIYSKSDEKAKYSFSFDAENVE